MKLNISFLIIFLPLLSFLILSFVGYKVGDYGSKLITTLFIFFSWLLTLFEIFTKTIFNNCGYLNFSNWIYSDLLSINWVFVFNGLSIIMVFIVLTISLNVHIYSFYYMNNDPHVPRFFGFLSLFTFFMILLVTSNNLLQLFFGWEGIGFCSYLLINFWYERLQANKSSIKALIINRIGDLFLLMAIFIMFFIFKSLELNIIFSLIPYFYKKSFIFLTLEIKIIFFICFFLFLGAMGKSAQLGLHTWLPDAMEGPTPVSALLHAATMVTAGVFLIIKFSYIFEYCPQILFFVSIVGSLTALFSSIIGSFQTDIKKIIAYSTCSQLGYMFLVCGTSNYDIALFHLFNHSFFKALLFLSAGSIIHSLNDEQDIRKMGGLKNLLPITYISFFIGSISISGLPFLSGFYSKDKLLEVLFFNYSFNSSFFWWLGLITAFFTSFYSFKLFYIIFLEPYNYNNWCTINTNLNYEPILMKFPLIFLSLCSISSGFIFNDIFIGLGSTFFFNSIFIMIENLNFIDSNFYGFWVKNVPSLFSFIGISFVFFFFKNRNFFNFINKKLFFNKWFVDLIINHFLAKTIMYFSYNTIFKLLDKGIIEFLGPKGVSYSVFIFSQNYTKIQSGFIYNYIFIFSTSIFYYIVLYNIYF